MTISDVKSWLESFNDEHDMIMIWSVREKINFLIQEVEKQESKNRGLINITKELVEFAEEEVKEIGGCDHDVNICCCGIYSMIDRAKEMI